MKILSLISKTFSLEKKPVKFLALGIALLIVLVFAYTGFLKASTQIDYALFSIDQTFSWRSTPEGILRTDALADYDTLLLSKDSWNDFDLSFLLINPKDCGVLYNFKDDKNFHFVYFNKAQQKIFIGLNTQQKPYLIKSFPFDISLVLRVNLKVDQNTVHIAINDKPLFQFNIPQAEGKLALVLNDAKLPKTAFSQISMSGHTRDGRHIVRRASPEYLSGSHLISSFFLLAAMLAFSGYLAKVFEYLSKNALAHPTQKNSFGILWAVFIHLLTATFVFWPFLLKGSVLVSSADNFGEIFPLFFLSKHNFIDILSGQSLSLWNPYTHNGMPFFSSHWNMIYYPLNWVIFLFDDKNVLTALTARTFLEVFLIGIFAYQFFRRELRSQGWALFSSVVYQLCSLLIFTLTVFPAISLYFAMTLYLYLIWSLSERTKIWNYLWVTVSLILIFTSANMAFIFYAGISLAIFTVYRLISQEVGQKARNENFVLIFASVITAILISAIRLIPCALGILASNRIVDNFYTLHDRSAMLVRLFVPEIAGWFGSHSFNALTSRNLNLIFERSDLPSNSQNMFFVYFGIVAALLLVCNLFIKAKNQHGFWKLYSFLAVAAALLFQPIWGILSILLFPLNHYSYHLIILPVGICMLAGYTGLYLEQGKFDIFKNLNRLTAILLLLQALLIVILTYLFPSLTVLSRIIFLSMIGWYVILRFHVSKNQHDRNAFLVKTTLAMTVFAWIAMFLTATAIFIRPIDEKEGAAAFIFIPALIIFAVIAAAFTIYMNFIRRKTVFNLTKMIICFLAGFMIIFAIFLRPFLLSLFNLDAPVLTYGLDIFLGHLRFWLIALIFFSAVVSFQLRWVSARLLIGLCIFVTIFDLFCFNARFDNVVAPTPLKEAYYKIPFPYQDLDVKLRSSIDIVNYRCDAIHTGGMLSNKNLIFGVPSYSGIIGYMPKRFSDLINNFGYPKGTVLIYPSDVAQSERFLDLSAAKYTFKDLASAQVRPSALSRLMLFYNYSIIPDDRRTLEILKDEKFNPQAEILLSQPLQENFTASPGLPGKAVFISAATSDAVAANVETPTPALLLFSESYSNGWKAYVDDRPAPVYRANFNFLACPIPSGEHKVIFRFEPKSFFVSAWISLAGLVMFFAASIYLISRKNKKEKILS